MNYIPKGLPGEFNVMLPLEDTNLKQECDEIAVQNGTMDCMNKMVAKIRDKILYLRREIQRETNFFHRNGHHEGKR